MIVRSLLAQWSRTSRAAPGFLKKAGICLVEHQPMECGELHMRVFDRDYFGIPLPVARQVRRHFPAKNFTNVGMPFFGASSATFAAGSMPRTEFPFPQSTGANSRHCSPTPRPDYSGSDRNAP
jgi:hypothetical protein